MRILEWEFPGAEDREFRVMMDYERFGDTIDVYGFAVYRLDLDGWTEVTEDLDPSEYDRLYGRAIGKARDE